MPSFSAIFRHHFAQSHYFSYMLTRLRVWGRSRESKPNSSGFQKRKLSNENGKEGMYREELGELPEIPSGEMSKIRTFIRKINRSAGESTAGQFTLAEGYTMMDNNRTCANDGIEVVSNRVSHLKFYGFLLYLFRLKLTSCLYGPSHRTRTASKDWAFWILFENRRLI